MPPWGRGCAWLLIRLSPGACGQAEAAGSHGPAAPRQNTQEPRVLLPEPAACVPGAALILPCSCPAPTLLMLPPPWGASPHPPWPAMRLLFPRASPRGRDTHQSPTGAISALGSAAQPRAVLSTNGDPKAPGHLHYWCRHLPLGPVPAGHLTSRREASSGTCPGLSWLPRSLLAPLPLQPLHLPHLRGRC